MTVLILLFLQSCSLLPQFPTDSLGKPLEKPRGLYRGAFHVHTHHSHDSKGSLESLRRAAHTRRLDFVVITDHNTLRGREEYEKSGLAALPLLIFGNEISTREGHVIALGIDEEIQPPVGAQEAIQKIHSLGGYAVLAHPVCRRSYWKDWGVKGFDGIEVYNQACNFYHANKIGFFLKSLFFPPSLFTRKFVKESREALKQWDSLMASGPLPAFGAIDAHQRPVLGFPLLRYSLSFRAVTMYVFSDTLSEREILKALFAGKSFITFEALGRAEGFSFKAKVGEEEMHMGSLIPRGAPIALLVALPEEAEIQLLCNGSLVKKVNARSLVFEAKEPGTYRVEVFRHGRLWILSNPITIQA